MRIRATEFWITTDEMRDTGLPETFDRLRFEKEADKVPFICVNDTFLSMIALDDMELPEDFEFSPTSSKLKNQMPGVYKINKYEVPPATLDDNGTRKQGGDGLNEILGVSSAMVYAGKCGTYSMWHVEDADFSSCNLLLPFSAGKAWIGVNPDDQWKLDEI
uniref:JmjC domain-containing protein n=1 Tax=Panagrolaimus superbus TaxID=310955 RepID=A0A914Z449_9BILA